jgi:hypothetical protein
LKAKITIESDVKTRISSARRLQREVPRSTKRCQGHQNEFRNTFEDEILEKIVLIWTPAKTMKKTLPNPPRRGGYKETPPEGPKGPRVFKISFGALWKINSSRKSL